MNNQQLVSLVKNLLRREATLNVQVLEALNVMYKRKLWLSQGYTTFHAYCVAVLHMSEDSAARRLQVAELLQRYPTILKPLILARGVHMSGLALLYAVITDDNAERLLNEAAGKSRRQIEEIRAREKPKADIASGFRRQPVQSCVPQPTTVEATHAAAQQQPAVAYQSKQQPIEVRSPDRYAFRTMMSAKTKEAFERICDMAGDKDYEQLFAAMVEHFETEMHRRKHAKLKREPKTKASKVEAIKPPAIEAAPAAVIKEINNRDIPADVKRAVWKRDHGRCTFVGDCGRCNTTRNIQYHHIINASQGGPATVDNITLHCKAHNLYQAELDFGPAFMARAIARSSGSAPVRVTAPPR